MQAHRLAPRRLPSLNPRARKGRDDSNSSSHRILQVSTHAPARGATLPYDYDTDKYLFQPTRPQGARQAFAVRRDSPVGFNPRARKGRDWDRGRMGGVAMFQPTRPQGARLRVYRLISSRVSVWQVESA